MSTLFFIAVSYRCECHRFPFSLLRGRLICKLMEKGLHVPLERPYRRSKMRTFSGEENEEDRGNIIAVRCPRGLWWNSICQNLLPHVKLLLSL